MIKFSREKVLLLHQLITEETGGDAGVRDFGLLDSALENIYQTFDGRELYPTKQEKGAASISTPPTRRWPGWASPWRPEP